MSKVASPKKFAVFDIDGTLYRDALFHDCVRELEARGYLAEEHVAKVQKAWNDYKERAHKNAFKTFSETHVQAFVDAMQKINKKEFDSIVKHLITHKKNYVYTYTKGLLNDLKQQGYFLITISGSFQEIVEPFAKYHGFDVAIGELNEWGSDGHFTGKTTRITFKNKHLQLEKLVAEHNLTYEGSYAIGDTLGDAEVLAMVENPIAFNPEQNLYTMARKNGWKIVVERKNVIYELEPKDHEYLLA